MADSTGNSAWTLRDLGGTARQVFAGMTVPSLNSGQCRVTTQFTAGDAWEWITDWQDLSNLAALNETFCAGGFLSNGGGSAYNKSARGVDASANIHIQSRSFSPNYFFGINTGAWSPTGSSHWTFPEFGFLISTFAADVYEFGAFKFRFADNNAPSFEYRIRKAGTVVTFDVSSDGGASFTTIYTSLRTPGAGTAYYPVVVVDKLHTRIQGVKNIL